MSAEPPTNAGGKPLIRRLLAGVVAGMAAGLFLGEEARVLQTVADGFVKLMQMAVLPYVTVSIVASIGALDLVEIRRLGVRVALVLAGLWSLALTFAFLLPLALPPARNASFFSTTLLEPPVPFSVVDLYIPANPFHALANSVVPAVVLFSIVIGVALNSLPRKGPLLELLEVVSDTLAQTMRFVVRLTPYGIFAIVATTTGTFRIEELARLQVYLVVYAGLALVLALWVLPGLVGAITPIPAREIFAATREPLITAAIAGDQFIVLPLLIAACKALAGRHVNNVRHARAMPDVIVPVSFNFPHSGKLLSVSFVLFAAWFSDAAIPPADYPRLGVTAVVTMFGSVSTAVPFLLDAFRVPADTFQLFIASSVLNARFGTLVAAMHTVTMALIGTCAVTGELRWRPGAVCRYAAVTVALALAVIGGTRVAAERLLAGSPAAGDMLDAMRVDRQTEAVVLDRLTPPPLVPAAGARLAAIAAHRRLRVGYLSDALPYAFVNGRGELVGFDIALMHRLAIELGARLEFVPVERQSLDLPQGAAELMRQGYCDIIVGGLAVTTSRAEVMQLSSPYFDETIGFVVPDGKRRRFESWEAIRSAGALTIAVPDVPYYVDILRRLLPQANLRPIATFDALFHTPPGDVAAFAVPAERGSAWTLRYPEYSVVVPSPSPISVPLTYAMPRGEPDLTAFVDTWIDLMRRDRTLEELYHYWILGRDPGSAAPRWSVIRNVLHWVE